jgi:EF-P beta-lysylation protein EpmB
MATPVRLNDADTGTWQTQLSQSIDDLDTLAEHLALDAGELHRRCAENIFSLRVPMSFVDRMRTGDANDPLLLQILPLREEQETVAGFTVDPLQEHAASPCPGLIHKYPGRVLLTAAPTCPVHCRYCFRRHFPYADNRLTPATWQPAIDYIRNDLSIREVILSGGEPLMMSDRLLSRLLDELDAIEHVSLLRIHTRYPVMVPQRLTELFCQRLMQSRCRMTLVLHCNHANEIDNTVRRYLAPLVSSPVTLLNQTVLLRDINNNPETLADLSHALFDAGVLPYYLHVLDPVAGTAHFSIDDVSARQLHAAMINTLPGYLVPALVREVPGNLAKTRL